MFFSSSLTFSSKLPRPADAKPRVLLTVFALCFVGAYGLEQSIVDVWIMMIAGVLGFVLKRYGFSPAPIIMGLVLGGLVETSLAQSMIIFDQRWTGFLGQPIALVFFALAAVSILSAPLRAAIRLVLSRSRGTA